MVTFITGLSNHDDDKNVKIKKKSNEQLNKNCSAALFWYIFSLIARQTLLNLIGIAINAIVVLISKGLVYKCVCRKVVPGEESPAYPRNLGEPSFHKIPYKTC